MGKSCNHAVVMAKLIIDGNDHGIQAFVVQLRSLEDHKTLPGRILNEKLNLSEDFFNKKFRKGLELGDIGTKFGFDTTDNGYLRFNKFRIPLNNMLMKTASN